MRKIFLLFTMALSLSSFAEDAPALIVVRDGVETSFALADIRKITYTETEMVVSTTDGLMHTLAMDDITAMLFGTTTGIKSTAQTSDRADGTSVMINGIRTDVANQKGIYIINVGKETRKIAK